MELKLYEILSRNISDNILRNLNTAVKDGNRDEIYRKSKILVSYILQDAIMCKNPAFQEEKEYGCIADIEKKRKKMSVI